LIYSLGIASHNGRFVNKDVNESLLEKLYSELNSKIAEEAIDEEVESSTYYVSNEEADEDAKQRDYSAFNDYASTLQQHSDRTINTEKRGWVAQAILDYVDEVGAATFTEMNEFYKAITLGSNSFTHILQNLRVPYKNRKTQRYLAKEGKGGSNAKWVVKVANPSNWVVNEY
jgi:hypothetical protein